MSGYQPMYVRIYVCINVCMYVCMHTYFMNDCVCMHA